MSSTRPRKPNHKIRSNDLLLDLIQSAIIDYKLILPQQKIVLGLSGGPDSVFLFHAFLILQKHIPFTFMAVHFNHSLRHEADADEAFCRKLCAQHGIRFVSVKEDIRAGQIRSGMSPEEYARGRRHAFFEKVRISGKADRIALAHHRDDLVETFLMRICAGSGLQGLAAIKPISGKVIHPLLWTGRDEIMEYLGRNKIVYRIDKSNEDVRYTRNLFRHEVLPLIEKEYKSCRGNISRLTDIVREENRYFDEAVDSFIARNAKRDSTRTLIGLKAFLELDKALQRRILMKVLPLPGYQLIEIILGSISGKDEIDKVIVHTSGQYVASERGDLVVSDSPPILNEIAFKRKINLKAGGKFFIKAIRAELSWEIVPYMQGMSLKERTSVSLDADKTGFSGVVRGRKPGDRIHGLGMKGSSSLKNLFINAKVVEADRWRVPVLEFPSGIAAVFFNFADPQKFNYISQDFSVGKTTRHVLCFHLIKLEQKQGESCLIWDSIIRISEKRTSRKGVSRRSSRS